MAWHERCGYAIITLMIFRILWGLWGSQTARFSDFVRSPLAVLRYLKGQASTTPGHNPLGALSVLAMIAVVLLQGLTGLIIDDEIATRGPLADKVPNAWVSMATTLHRINEKVIYLLVFMHLGAIVYHRKKGHRLLPAMWHGRASSSHPQPRIASVWLATLTLLVAAVAVYVLVVVYATRQ
jgi:cytochrome b